VNKQFYTAEHAIHMRIAKALVDRALVHLSKARDAAMALAEMEKPSLRLVKDD